MCGICGFFSFGRNLSVDPSTLERMTEVMSHRGPDGSGTYISKDRKLGLGHRRLSIIDLESGKQPMSNENDTVWIVYNGEIYNHAALREELEKSGHIYKTNSDTETIIHCYEEYGTEFLDYLEGMFSFCLWDSKNRMIVLARDRIGIKPLYYAELNGTLLFASEIKAILAHPSVTRDVDLTALNHYFTFLVTPPPHTLFKGIKKLPAGHLLICQQGSHPNIKQYWDAISPSVSTSQIYSDEYYIDNIRTLLRNSIEARMMSDVPFGVFLSGGIDSSLIVALMAEFSDKPVNTFTVAYDGKNTDQFNEMPYARQIARMFQTNHHEIVVDDKKLIDYLPNLIYHQDEPIGDPVCIPLYYVSKLARDNGVKVVLVGEGSDELFAGYPLYLKTIRRYKQLNAYKQLPVLLQKILYYTLPPIFSLSYGSKRYNAMKDLMTLCNLNHLFLGGAILFSESQKKPLFTKEFIESSSDQNSLSIINSIYRKIEDLKPEAKFLEKMTYLELKQRLPELLLMRVDKITMSTSVEGRVPFLDHKLVEFVMNIPMEVKVKNQSKFILKKAAEGIIPENIIYRKKRGFPAPIEKWLMGDLGPFMKSTFDNATKLKERNWLNFEHVNEMLQKQLVGDKGLDRYLWLVLNFSLWYDYWIEGKEIRLHA